MMRSRVGMLVLVTLIAVAASCLFLPAAKSLFVFGARGFGTVYAQTTFWLAARAIGWNSNMAGAEQKVWAAQSGLIVLIYAALAVGVTFTVRRYRVGIATAAILLLFTSYELLLFLWPQAQFGP